MPRLTDDALDVLFRRARTFKAWLDKPVTDETLRHGIGIGKHLNLHGTELNQLRPGLPSHLEG